MRKRYWNRKVSALLMAGLVLSALPVHAFAEEDKVLPEEKYSLASASDLPAEENEDDAAWREVDAYIENDSQETDVDIFDDETEEELAIASASDIPMATDTEAEDSLLGTWTVDGYTSLAFYGDGKGAMLLPTASYEFHYTLSDDRLDLDFVSSRARDMRYTISLESDTLQLTSGTGTKSVTITLQRVE